MATLSLSWAVYFKPNLIMDIIFRYYADMDSGSVGSTSPPPSPLSPNPSLESNEGIIQLLLLSPLAYVHAEEITYGIACRTHGACQQASSIQKLLTLFPF